MLAAAGKYNDGNTQIERGLSMIILYGLDFWATMSPLVWWLSSKHHSCREFFMLTSEPKPHEVNKIGSVLSIPKFETWLRKML